MDTNSLLQPYVDTDGVIRIKPAEVDSEGNIVPDPTWTKLVDDYRSGKYEERTLIEGPLPMLLNLGDFGRGQEMLGHAFVYQSTDGRKRIEIVLTLEASEALANLAEVFELKGVGFAGVERKPRSTSDH